VCLAAVALSLVQVMYLDQVVDRLLLGHRNSQQHQSLLQQHKNGSMTPVVQVSKHIHVGNQPRLKQQQPAAGPKGLCCSHGILAPAGVLAPPTAVLCFFGDLFAALRLLEILRHKFVCMMSGHDTPCFPAISVAAACLVLQVAHAMSVLVRDLVLQLHQIEPDPDAVILVFLPTYRALLLQHKLLLDSAGGSGITSPHGSAQLGASGDLDVFALHSSVDIDEALEAIQGPRVAGRRRIVLATNCAESSITLPNVKHVVDSCTTNQVGGWVGGGGCMHSLGC